MGHAINNADEATQRFWELSNRLRSRGLVSEQVIRSYLLALSTFVLLRNADLEEDERQAIAEFDLSEYSPQLPHDLSWGTISCIDPPVLHSSLELKVWPALLALHPSDFGSPLRRIPAAVDLKAVPDEVLVAARTAVAETWTNTAGRDVLATEFEQILRSWVEQTRFSGEFATPPVLADLMVELAAPRVGDRVYDPCFGTGGLLVRAARRIVHEGMSLSSRDWDQLRSHSIFGVDIQPHLALIATARLVLAGMSFPKLETGNSLERNGMGDQGNEGFDCILANPPFGSRVSEAAAGRFRIRSTSAEVLFLQHILRSLRPGGRAVVLVPEGILFRSGAEAKLRQVLLTDYRVDAVLSLPAGSGALSRSVKTDLLLFSRQSPRKTVCFVDTNVVASLLTGPGALQLRRDLMNTIASQAVEQPLSYTNELRAGGVDASETVFMIGGPTLDGSVATVKLDSVERLAERNWELVAKDTGRAALDVFLERALEARADSRVCKLSEIADIFRGIQYNRSSFVESSAPSDAIESIPFVRVQDVTRASRSRSDHTRLPEVRRPTAYLTEEAAHEVEPHRRLRVGDVLISASGTVGNVAIVGEGIAGAVPAQSVFVIRVTGNLQAPVLIRLLQSQTFQSWLQGHSSGRIIRHLSIRALRELPVLVLDEVVQRALARELSEGASDDRILQLLSGATGQSYWLTLIQNDSVLGPLERCSESKDLNAWGLLADWLGPSPSWEADAARDAERDPFANWLLTWTQAARALRQAREIPHPMSRFAALQGWKSELIGASPSNIDATGSYKSLQGRAARLGALGAMAALAPVLGVAGVTGAGVASLLDHRIDRSLPQGTSAAQRRAQKLTALLLTLADSEIKSLLERVQLDITAEPSILPVGEDSEIELRLKNIGPLAVGAVRVLTAPVHSEAELLFLDVGQELSWAMPLQPSEPGQLSINVDWSATRLDDSRVSGHSEVSVSIVSRSSVTPALRPLETSPYVTGNPIGAERPEMFFGRDEILARIRRSLRQEGPGTVLILEGVRRSGKTSILKQLVDVQPPHGWIPVYWSSQSGDGKQRVEGIPSGSLFYTIARECILAAHAKGVTFTVPKVGAVPPQLGRVDLALSLYEHLKPVFSEEGSFELLDVIVEALVAAAAPKRFLLVLDEFDKIQEGITAGVTSPQVPENMRYLFHTYPALSGIISGSPEIRRLRDRYWGALFGIGNVIRVTGLDPESAKRLVIEPAENMLVYAPSAIDLILTLCARQPYLIQLLCEEIFQRAAQNGNRSITVTGIESAATGDAVIKSEQFRFLWQSVGSDLRRYIVCLIDRLTRADQRVTLDLIIEKLEEDALIDDGQLVGAEMQELLDFEIVSLKEDELGSSYQIAVPLFSYWIRSNVDERIHREAILNDRSAN